MRMLLLHDITPDTDVAAALDAAGHEVVRCAEPGDRAFPCVRVDGGTCPLDGTVDVAVVVHDKPTAGLAFGEAGVICALRDGLPLVVAGTHAFSPFVERADAVADDLADIPAACLRAVAAAADRDARAIAEAAGTAVAAVERAGGRVRVRLPDGASERDAVVAHQAATRRFPRARVIDVGRG